MEKKTKTKKYIVRCDRAGVFYGEIKSRKAGEITMANVRKVWYWDGACAVEELATNGTTTPDNCKLTVRVDEITVMGVIQIIPCTDKAVKSLEAAREWKRG